MTEALRNLKNCEKEISLCETKLKALREQKPKLESICCADNWFNEIKNQWCPDEPDLDLDEYVVDNNTVSYTKDGYKLTFFGRVTWKGDDLDYYSNAKFFYRNRKVAMRTENRDEVFVNVPYPWPKAKKRGRKI